MRPALLAIVALALLREPQFQPPPVTGGLPSGLDTPARTFWIAASPDAEDVRCHTSTPGQWSCDGLLTGARGLIVLVGDGRIGAVPVGVPGARATTATWGRVVRVTPGGVGPDELHDLRLMAWTPERSRVRPQTRLFSSTKDTEVQTVRLSDTAFWVTGNAVDPDAFVALDGPAIGTSRLSTRTLSEGAPEDPVFIAAAQPVSLTGYVRGAHGEDGDNAEVELLEPLQTVAAAPEPLDARTPLVRRLTVIASADGRFQFDRLADGPFRVVATHSTLGRGGAWVSDIGPPVVIELTSAPRATGRVLRHDLPVAAARIRFLPAPDAWAASVDPRESITAETTSNNDGTFSLALPPNHAGTIQALLDDGAGVRVRVPSLEQKGNILMGDLKVPDKRHLVVRLLDALVCNVVAAGPLGALGLAIVRATSQTNVYELTLPDAGAWALNAECGGEVYPLDPSVVVVPANGQAPAVDAHVVKSPEIS